MSEYRDPVGLLDLSIETLEHRTIHNRPSLWAESDGQIDFPPGSPIPGPLNLGRLPFTRTIMDAMGPLDPCGTVVLMSSGQASKTLCYLCALGERLDEHPAPCMIVLPKLEDVHGFDTTKLAPFLAASARLRVKVGLPGMVNNTEMTEFPDGAVLCVAGARSASTFRIDSYVIVILDDLCAFPESPEGDPVELAHGRTSMYRNQGPKVVIASSPVDTDGPTDYQWQLSSQELLYVPCLECGVYQSFELTQLEWTPKLPGTAHFRCIGSDCGKKIYQHEVSAMNARHQWRARHPERKATSRGFHFSQANMPREFANWAHFAQKWEAAEEDFRKTKNEDKRRVLYNVMAGLPYQSIANIKLEGTQRDAFERREQPWNAVELPVIIRTVGVDPGGHGLDSLLLGTGAKRERWVLDYRRQKGDVMFNSTWDTWFDWLIETGTDAVCVDAGWKQKTVCDHLHRLSHRFLDHDISFWAIKGQSGEGALWPPNITELGNYKGSAVTPVSIYIDQAKGWIYDSLAMDAKTGENVVHISVERDRRWFQQLFGERRKEAGDKAGKNTIYVKRHKTNRVEALDALVYAIAAVDAMCTRDPKLFDEIEGVEFPAAVPVARHSLNQPTPSASSGLESVW